MEDYSEPLSFQGNPVSLSTAVQIAGRHPPFTKQERDLLYLAFVRTGGAQPRRFLKSAWTRERGKAIQKKWKLWLGVLRQVDTTGH